MNNALVVGGSSGLGLAIVISLLKKDYQKIYIVDKNNVNFEDVPSSLEKEVEKKVVFLKTNLVSEDYTIFDEINDINTLFITAGFGRATLFENLSEIEISNLIKCNEISAIQVIKKYYDKISSNEDFYCMATGSIAGHIVSPFFSVYGASKAGLRSFVESANIELSKKGVNNRILDVSPGSIAGTNFNGTGNSIEQINELAEEIIFKTLNRETLYIPHYDDIYKDVIERYQNNPEKFGLESYEYKLNSGRIKNESNIIIGYLSGTFDLFHIGHLNLLRRAKEQCDYLIVGVHESGAWKGKETFIPFEERKEIVGSIKYVDKVVKSCTEDVDAYELYKYNKLFVGSDYKGTERFNRYEEYFADKGVKIVYFPYTKGTSSTQLRKALSDKKK